MANRTVVLKMVLSFDGFATSPDGTHDWMFEFFGDDSAEWNLRALDQAGTHAMGRRSYEIMGPHWQASEGPIATFMNEKPKAVFSNTLERASWGPAEVFGGDLAAAVAELKARDDDGTILVHGGPNLAKSMTRLGLVDEYQLTRVPILSTGHASRGAPSRSIGESTQAIAISSATFARRGTASCARRRRAVVTQAGRNSAASRSSPGGRRRANSTIATHDSTHSPSVTAAISISSRRSMSAVQHDGRPTGSRRQDRGARGSYGEFPPRRPLKMHVPPSQTQKTAGHQPARPRAVVAQDRGGAWRARAS
jgi:dihydrofolate reductase